MASKSRSRNGKGTRANAKASKNTAPKPAERKADKPKFEVGDIVHCDGEEGIVEHIHTIDGETDLLTRNIDLEGTMYRNCIARHDDECVRSIPFSYAVQVREAAGLPLFDASVVGLGEDFSVDPTLTLAGMLKMLRVVENRYGRLVGETIDHLTAECHENLDQVVTSRIAKAFQDLDENLGELLHCIIANQTAKAEKQPTAQLPEEEALQEA